MQQLELQQKNNGVFYIENQFSNFIIGVAAKNSNTTNYNLDFKKIRKYERYLLHTITGIPADQIFFLNQVHEAESIIINSVPKEKLPFIGDADAMLTAKKNFCLVIRTADCVPVLIIDPVQNCIAAIHSGWRSTEKKISAKTIQKMKNNFNSNPADLKAYILPSIGPDSYIVKMDVAANFPGHFQEKGTDIYLDLWSGIESALLTAGVLPENIFNSKQCTVINNNNFFSHRKGDRGRNLNFIYIKQ